MNDTAKQLQQWPSSHQAITIHCVDAHTGGEPLRVITAGFPELKGRTILEKRRNCQAQHDHLRRALMLEPRGHADMYGALVVAPERSDSHLGAIFIHNEGYSTMCGHAVIALTKLAVESGLVAVTGAQTAVNIDVPCGQIKAMAHADPKRDGRVGQVSFECVPSYVVALDQTVQVPGLGQISYDLAFGGAYYAYLQAVDVGLRCQPSDLDAMVRLGREIKTLVNEQQNITHPEFEDLGFLYGCIFIDDSDQPGVHSRNVCVFADGEVDRSPTGSGVSGRAAIHVARGELPLGEIITIESVVGSRFDVQANQALDYHGLNAIIPEVSGQAHITGRHEFIMDPDDVLGAGFMLR